MSVRLPMSCRGSARRAGRGPGSCSIPPWRARHREPGRAARRPGRPLHTVQLGLRVHADPRPRPRPPAASTCCWTTPYRPSDLRLATCCTCGGRRRHGRAVRPARSQDPGPAVQSLENHATGHGWSFPGVVPDGRADLRAGERRRRRVRDRAGLTGGRLDGDRQHLARRVQLVVAVSRGPAAGRGCRPAANGALGIWISSSPRPVQPAHLQWAGPAAGLVARWRAGGPSSGIRSAARACTPGSIRPAARPSGGWCGSTARCRR